MCLSGVPKSMIKSLESECGYAVYVPQRKLFPDGEQYLRIEFRSISDNVVVTQSLYPEQDRKIVELYLALEALQGLDIHVDTVVLPYVAYTRQDKRFLFGEPISTKALYNALKIFGVTK
ncbi:MAG: ribose-phosphate pyrophosphokinase-like domain-containing protein, partial [Ignisphaera sp.]